jgi:tRNA(His) 5'-end guanylyltransferase
MQLWKKLGLPKPKSEASGGPLSLVDHEIYSGLEVPPGPFFVRLDGWSFHSLCERLKFKKPFDARLAKGMSKAAKALFVFNPVLAYVFSDEINVLFLSSTAFRRIEKIDSIFAALASAAFSKEIGMAAFDCRVIPLMNRRNILRYLIWRQAECWRNHNNAWAQWAAVHKEGLSPRDASKRLSGLKTAQLAKYCLAHGIDLNATPAWQRNGIIIYKIPYKKRGYDPIKKKTVTAIRHKIITKEAPFLEQRLERSRCWIFLD